MITSIFPPEFLRLLNQAYFFHVLATDPEKIIPPGKSLLSMVVSTAVAQPSSPLQARVYEVMHNVFWDEALLSLSSPSPSVQLTRLKSLHNDLHDVLSCLLPPEHPILIVLAAPLSPTSSPLRSTLALLKEILSALRQLCAPIRDSDIDSIIRDLTSSPALTQSLFTAGGLSGSPLATLVVSTLRRLTSLTEVLKHDLSNSLFGVMPEAQLFLCVQQHARARERELVLDPEMWGGEDVKLPLNLMKEEWRLWLQRSTRSKPERTMWISRLMVALASSTPVTCHALGTSPNALPPQFFFAGPKLLFIQNYLQALVITAVLKSLIRLPSDSTTASGHSTPDFVPRVWSLLIAEVDHNWNNLRANPQDNQVRTDETKLIHLSDEVIRALQLSSTTSVSRQKEQELRSAVDRTVRLSDPVFVLLQTRLICAIEKKIEDAWISANSNNITGGTIRLPKEMKAGRSKVQNTWLQGANNSVNLAFPMLKFDPPIKGFEHKVLTEGIEQIMGTIVACIERVKDIWADTIIESL